MKQKRAEYYRTTGREERAQQIERGEDQGDGVDAKRRSRKNVATKEDNRRLKNQEVSLRHSEAQVLEEKVRVPGIRQHHPPKANGNRCDWDWSRPRSRPDNREAVKEDTGEELNAGRTSGVQGVRTLERK